MVPRGDVVRLAGPGSLAAVSERAAPARSRSSLVFWLGLLATERAAEHKRFRGARWSGWLVALSGVAAVGLAVWIGAGDVADLLALRVLAYAAWLYALVGLPALLHPDFAPSAVSGLARLRGVAEVGPLARGFGIFARLALGLAIAALPGVVLAALSSQTAAVLAARVMLVLAAALYLILLAASLALVGVWAERLAPRAPRRTAVLLLLGPYLVSLALPGVPSVPGAFFWAFERLVVWGGYLT